MIFYAGAALAVIVEWGLFKPAPLYQAPWVAFIAVVVFVLAGGWIAAKIFKEVKAQGSLSLRWKQVLLSVALIGCQLILAQVIKMSFFS